MALSKKYKIIFGAMGVSAIIISILLVFVQYQNKKSQTLINLSEEQKLSDFDTLCAVLDEGYPFWNDIEQTGINKEVLYDTYRNSIINTKTDIEFFKVINEFLKSFKGIGHLSVLDGYMYRFYMEACSSGNDLLSDLEVRKTQPLIAVLTNPLSQTIYSLLDQSHSGFRSTVGLKEKYKNQGSVTSTENASQPVTQIDKDRKTAYIKLDDFSLTHYQTDSLFLKEFFSTINDIPNLVIDLRENKGGSDLYWKDLLVRPNVKERMKSERYYFFNINETTQDYILANEIEAKKIDTVPEPYLSKYKTMFSHYTVEETSFEVSKNPYKGKIWVLVSENVYSASENFVMFCKNTGFATLIGTTTGGDGGIADPMLVSLPNSGLIIRFSMFYGTNPDGSGNEASGTTPDIILSSEEDTLEKCLELIK